MSNHKVALLNNTYGHNPYSDWMMAVEHLYSLVAGWGRLATVVNRHVAVRGMKEPIGFKNYPSNRIT